MVINSKARETEDMRREEVGAGKIIQRHLGKAQISGREGPQLLQRKTKRV